MLGQKVEMGELKRLAHRLIVADEFHELTQARQAFRDAAQPGIILRLIELVEASLCEECKGQKIVLQGCEPGGCDWCGATGKSGACGNHVVAGRALGDDE